MRILLFAVLLSFVFLLPHRTYANNQTGSSALQIAKLTDRQINFREVWFEIIKHFRTQPDAHKQVIVLSVNASTQELFNRHLLNQLNSAGKIDYKYYAKTARSLSSYLLQLAELSRDTHLIKIYNERLKLYDQALSDKITEQDFDNKRHVINADFNRIALDLKTNQPERLQAAFDASRASIPLISQYIYLSARMETNR